MTVAARSSASTRSSASRAGEPTANETVSRVCRATIPIVSSMNEPKTSFSRSRSPVTSCVAISLLYVLTTERPPVWEAVRGVWVRLLGAAQPPQRQSGPGIGAGRMIGRSDDAIGDNARDPVGPPSTGNRHVGHAAQADGATLRSTPQGGAPLADKGPERSRSRAGHPHVETRPDPRSAEASTRGDLSVFRRQDPDLSRLWPRVHLDRRRARVLREPWPSEPAEPLPR